MGSSETSMPASENGWMRSYWWPITSAGVLQLAPLLARRRGAAEEQALQHRGARLRVLADPVEQDVGLPRQRPPRDAAAPRAPARRIAGSPAVSATISGVKASAQPSSAWSSTGISITMPRKRSGACGDGLERRVGAQRRAHHDRLGLAQVVEQRDDLRAEGRHRVAPLLARAVGLAVAEQVERDDAVPALGERLRQRLVHALGEQQAVQQDRQARALAVDRVGQPLAVEREAAHRLIRLGRMPVIRPMTEDDVRARAAS